MSWFAVGAMAVNTVGDYMNAKGTKSATGRAMKEQLGAVDDGIDEQRAINTDIQSYFQPYTDYGNEGLSRTDLLFDPQAQYDFLQNNPLFQMSLDNANTNTNKMAAAKGRLNAGDTMEQLSNNVLLASQPLLDRQTANINNAINMGYNSSSNQANARLNTGNAISGLMVNKGDILAAGILGRQNAQNEINSGIASSASSFLSGYGGSIFGGGGGSGGGGGNTFGLNGYGDFGRN